MLDEICAECKNYFIRGTADVHAGTFTIRDGVIQDVPFLTNGQYFRIVGSLFNDGVYLFKEPEVPAESAVQPVNAGGAENARSSEPPELKGETFYGAIWAMRVPPAFIALSDEIKTWQTANDDALKSPYQSESFGGYSYSKANGANGAAWTWKDQFSGKLNRWRRLSVI